MCISLLSFRRIPAGDIYALVILPQHNHSVVFSFADVVSSPQLLLSAVYMPYLAGAVR